MKTRKYHLAEIEISQRTHLKNTSEAETTAELKKDAVASVTTTVKIMSTTSENEIVIQVDGVSTIETTKMITMIREESSEAMEVETKKMVSIKTVIDRTLTTSMNESASQSQNDNGLVVLLVDATSLSNEQLTFHLTHLPQDRETIEISVISVTMVSFPATHRKARTNLEAAPGVTSTTTIVGLIETTEMTGVLGATCTSSVTAGNMTVMTQEIEITTAIIKTTLRHPDIKVTAKRSTTEKIQANVITNTDQQT